MRSPSSVVNILLYMTISDIIVPILTKECFLGDPLQKNKTNLISQKASPQGVRGLSGQGESPLKPMIRIQNNLADMITG